MSSTADHHPSDEGAAPGQPPSSPAPRPGRADGQRASGGVFSPPFRATTVGLLLSVGAVALESLGVATILPRAADELGGLGGYGWGLSALMLATVVGSVVAGGDVDRRGPARAVLLGSVVFALGCVLAGAAPTWGIFVAGRAVQGLGVGAVMACAYSLVGLAYPERLRPVMVAFLSSAWTIPSLVGPLAAGALVAVADWRAVFWLVGPAVLALLPLVLPGAVRAGRGSEAREATPADATRRDATRRARRSGLLASLVLTAASAALLAGLDARSPLAAVPLVVGGAIVALASLRRLVPSGTLRAARGPAAGIVVRFLLCAVYFGSEAFVPLGLTRLHGLDVVEAGLALATGALAWTLGSFVQARLDAARPGTRARSVRAGFVLLLVGEVVTGAAVSSPDAWWGGAVLGWSVAGVGMGVAFTAATSATLAASTSSTSSGADSAALQLAQTLATALTAGAGGAVLATTGTSPLGFGTVFAGTAALAVAGLLLAGRVEPRAIRVAPRAGRQEARVSRP